MRVEQTPGLVVTFADDLADLGIDEPGGLLAEKLLRAEGAGCG